MAPHIALHEIGVEFESRWVSFAKREQYAPEYLAMNPEGTMASAEMPNVRRVMTGGIHGHLVSTIPPITVPAWMSMMTSQDPGMLGIHGFRNRASRE